MRSRRKTKASTHPDGLRVLEISRGELDDLKRPAFMEQASTFWAKGEWDITSPGIEELETYCLSAWRRDVAIMVTIARVDGVDAGFAVTDQTLSFLHGVFVVEQFRSLTIGRQLVSYATPITAVGIDCGVANTLALSSRVNLHAPLMTAPEGRRVLFLERRLARCSRGSIRRAKALRRLNNFRSRINRRIHDWRHKTTTALSKNHGLIAVEDLALANMTASARGTVEAPGNNVAQKSGLNRALLEPGFGILFGMLAYKQEDRGHAFIRVNPAYTSQTCPECRHLDPGNRPSRDTFRCQCCGHTDEADFIGAINVLRRAQHQSLTEDSVLAAGHGRDCAPVARATRAHRGSHPRTNPSSRLAA